MFESVRRFGGLAAVSALALVASPRAAAQDPDPLRAPATPTRPFMADAAEGVPAPKVTIPVLGLTRWNRGEVIEELQALGEDLDLPFARVTPDVEKGVVSFVFAEDGVVSLSDVANTLENAGVTVNRAALTVPDGVELLLYGPADEEGVALLRRALEKAALFASFGLHADADRGEIWVTPRMRGARTYTELEADVAALGTGHELVDFVWVSPPAPGA